MSLNFRGCLTGGLMLILGLPSESLMAQQASPAATQSAHAQATMTTNSGRGHILSDSVSPFGLQLIKEEDAATVSMPKLDGSNTPTDGENFDKYYFFHRNEATFTTAFNDIAECDGYARGLTTGLRYQPTYSYTMAGIAGGAIGNLMAAAIFGSAEKRRVRRINMRACMGYKGYQRYGLPKNLWQKFNFEEGLDGISDEVRRPLLMQQALVASKAVPTTKALEQ
jgi:hypothetical protein